jgi:tetratricopeptide (TPR) repeat protein
MGKRKTEHRNYGKSTLALCMIVKDEEEKLAACLESVSGLVDEMIVVDTGSTDETIAIARRYGARVFESAWCDDFSASRNESLTHAKSDWILYLDADERLHPDQQDAIRTLLFDKSVGGYTLIIEGRHVLPEGPVDQVNAYPRLFRRGPGIRFHGRVHEQIGPSIERSGYRIVASEIRIVHLGYDASDEVIHQKCQRNLKLLKQELRDDQDNGYTLFQIGNTLCVLGENDEAEMHLQRALEARALSPGIQGSIYNLRSELAIRRGDVQAAAVCARRSLEVVPHQIMARWFLGSIELSQSNYPAAIEMLEDVESRVKDRRKSDLSFDLVVPLEDVYLKTGLAHYGVGRYHEAALRFQTILLHIESPDDNVFQSMLLSLDALKDAGLSVEMLEPLRSRGNGKIGLALARAYKELHRIQDANELITEIRNREPGNSEVRLQEAKWLAEEGKYHDAEQLISSDLQSENASYDLLRHAMEMALKRKDVQRAFHLLERMSVVVPSTRSDIHHKIEALRRILQHVHPA